MPTALHRIQVTVTPTLGDALTGASLIWPATPQSELVTRLAITGWTALEHTSSQRREQRRQALKLSAGSIDYPPDFLDDLRQDWPE